MEFMCLQRYQFAQVSLVILLYVRVHCEDSSLDNIPTSVFKLQRESNCSICKEATSFCKGRPAQNSSNLTFLNLEVEMYLIEQGICLTQISHDIFGSARLQMTHKGVNFTDCVVIRVMNSSYNASDSTNPSCELIRYSTQSRKKKSLVYAERNCEKTLKKKGYCLVFVSSLRKRNIEQECFGRTVKYSLHAKCAWSSSRPPRIASLDATSSNSSTITTKAPSNPDGIHTFIKSKPAIFGAIIAGIVLVVIMGVGLICCLCFKRNKGHLSIELKPLPSAPSTHGKVTGDRVLYHEPDVHSNCLFRNNPETEVSGIYDYAYAHHVPRRCGNQLDPVYVNVSETRRSDHDNNYSSYEEVEHRERRRYASLRRSETENEGEYQPLSSSSSTPHEAKTNTLYYVKVL